MGFGVCVLGHRHPDVAAAMSRISGSGWHFGIHSTEQLPLARLLQDAIPCAERILFCNSGSEATIYAMRAARAFTGKEKIGIFDGYWHGMHDYGLWGTVPSVASDYPRSRPDSVGVPPQSGETVLVAPFNDAAAAVAMIERHAHELAAVIVEPMVQGALGMRLYRPELLRALRELTRQHDVFLICDEVFTGYGRTGPFWASEHAGVAPDLLCTAKGFTAGMLPMSATLVSDRIFSGFLGDGERTFYYGHTFCGNPLGAALAREVLRVYRDERVLELAAGKAARIARAFEVFRSLPDVTETRTLGMIGALDLAGSKHYLEPRGKRVYAEALRRGAYLRPIGNTVYITPSLNIPDADLDELLGIVEESVRAA